MSHVIVGIDRPWDRLVWGFVLIGLGVFFLLSTSGYLPRHWFGSWWPLFVIAAGLGSLLCARTPRKLGSAVSLLGIGAWLMVAANGWLGLGWSRSWPLALVAAGFGSLVHGLAHAVWPRKEIRDEL
jgi:hypothetical protein